MIEGSKALILVPNTGEILKGCILRKLNNNNYICRLPGYKRYQEIPPKNIITYNEELDILINSIIEQVELDYDAGLNVSPTGALRYLFDEN